MANRIYLASKGYFTLRGDGQGKTILKDTITGGSVFSFGQVAGQGNGADNYLAGSNSLTLYSGYTQGSSNLVTTGSSLGIPNSGVVFHVGDLVQMSELNDTFVSSHGQAGQQTFSSITSDGQHCLNQMFLITAINNGTNLTVWPPVAWTYKSNLNPILYLQDFSHYSLPTCFHQAGFEHLSITNALGSASQKHVFDWYCGVQSWVYDVEIVNEKNYCGFLDDCLQCQIDSCNFHATSTNSIYYQNYDWETEFSSFVLFQNNIFNGCFEGLQIDSGGCGNVVGYNIFTNLYNLDDGVASFTPLLSLSHGAYPMLNLVEGNVGGGLQGDFYWGSAGYDTIFRNVFCGVDTPWTGAKNEENNICLKIDSSNEWYNVVGNILGTPAITSISCGKPNTWAYMMTTQPGLNAAQPVIYRLGYPGIDSNGYTGTNSGTQSLDANVLGTMIMVQNFDYANNSVQNATTVSLPASYYLTGKPSWFGNCPWPPFDPTNASAASVTNIPAGYRLIMGSAPPAGTLPPVAVASATPVSGTIPLSVAFSSAGSSDPGGATLTYSWAFGDSSTSTLANPSHVYQSVGVYNAQLTVSDGTNQTPSSVMTITATNAVTVSQPPVAVASENPTSGTAPLSVAFSSSGSSDPGGATLTYSWAFGDGSTSTFANPSHVYQSAGVYNAQLTVSDGVNQTSSSVMTITVAGATSGLVAAYGFEEGSGTVASDASGNGNTGTITGATWRYRWSLWRCACFQWNKLLGDGE